jgi:Domain of unknown function (DUF4398)
MRKIFDSKRSGMRRLTLARAATAACLFSMFAFLAGGCATAKPPTDILARAEVQLRTAAEARADELAPMDLQRAREKLESSKRAMAAGRYDEARRLAETAEVEAELAEAKADAEITHQAADRLRRTIDALRQEMERSPTRTTVKE